MLKFKILPLDFNCLKGFYWISHTRNMTRAALELQMDQSSLSRQISKLEDRFRTKLFSRSKGGMALTQEGRILLNSVQQIFEILQETDAQIQENQCNGILRVGLWSPITSLVLPTLNPFLKENPHIHVDFSQEFVPSDNFDVWIGPWLKKRERDLIQEPFITLQIGLYASQAYIEKEGPIASLKDLEQHAWIDYHPFLLRTIPQLDAYFSERRSKKSLLMAKSLADGEALAKSDCGIVHHFIVPEGQTPLVRLLPEEAPPKVDICIIYSKYQAYPQRFKDFRNYCLQTMKEGY